MVEAVKASGANQACDREIGAALHRAGFTADEIARNWPFIESYFDQKCAERIADAFGDWAKRMTAACDGARGAIADFLADLDRPVENHQDDHIQAAE
ncbi:MAG: hypothetical protein IT562_10710 [Alphaproteobacteria bacterium]|nr:hypothetical protein [Alphaproteobacteria bacterium]